MAHMCWRWIKYHRLVVSAAAIALLAVLIATLIALDGAGRGITFLGDVHAPRDTAGTAIASPAVSRSDDANATSGSPPKPDMPAASALDIPVSAEGGPQTVAAAQAAWSGGEIKHHQNQVLAAINCERKVKGQPALALDPALSATAGDAWLKLIRDRSFTLLDLPGRYELRSVMALDFGIPAQDAPANSQAWQRGEAPRCAVGGFDVAALPRTMRGTRVGIAVFPPQASWDGASAVVLVQ